MSWIAVAVAGAAVVAGIGGAAIQSSATRKASNAAEDAANRATEAQTQLQQPWTEAGEWSLNKLKGLISQGPGEYEKSPYYDFLMGEGSNALSRQMAARGMQKSGAEAKALTQFGQNLASTDYDNWLGRWYQSLSPYQSMAGQGLSATTNLSNQIGQNTLAAGQAQAAGQYGQGQIWGGAMNQMGQNALTYYLQNRQNNPITNYGSYASGTPWQTGLGGQEVYGFGQMQGY